MLAEAPLVQRWGDAIELGEPVTAVHWVGRDVAIALGDGTVRFWAMDAAMPRIAASHDGAILCAAADPGGRALLTGGDDGRVLRTAEDGTVQEIGRFGKWVDHLVASPTSAYVVAAVAREAVVWKPGAAAPSHRYDAPSSIGGIALDGKGKRLAFSHYGGVSLAYVASADATPQRLAWGGSHLACTFRPDGDYVITGTQELALHGWKLPERTDLAMRGYRAKTRSFSWSKRAKMLATSGDAQVVIWPFEAKDGPMGKPPRLAAQRQSIVTQVAFQPVSTMLAVGYADGAVFLSRVEDDAYLPVEEPGAGAVTMIAWSADGALLAWGCEDGRVGRLDLQRRAS